MKTLDLKVGFSCNNNCRFCVQGNKRKKYGDKSTAELKKLLRKGAKGHDRLILTGGEPTIREDLPELVGFAKEIGFKQIQIQTNGRRFAYRDFCEELIKRSE